MVVPVVRGAGPVNRMIVVQDVEQVFEERPAVLGDVVPIEWVAFRGIEPFRPHPGGFDLWMLRQEFDLVYLHETASARQMSMDGPGDLPR